MPQIIRMMIFILDFTNFFFKVCILSLKPEIILNLLSHNTAEFFFRGEKYLIVATQLCCHWNIHLTMRLHN